MFPTQLCDLKIYTAIENAIRIVADNLCWKERCAGWERNI